ncbi:MAG: TonB family protein, partial [Pseudomonadota bacterium]
AVRDTNRRDNNRGSVGYTSDKEMRLIIQSRWSPRKWRKLWQANISINNDSLPDSQVSRQALMDFINLPQEDLLPGDEVRIIASATGTRVLLNGEEAIRSNDRSVFRYLLNTWLGKLPPSRAFKNQILGQPFNNDFASRLEQHQFDSTRMLVSRWQQAEQQRLAALKRQQEQQRLEQQRLEQQRLEKQRLEQQRQAEQRRLAEQKKAAEQLRLQRLEQQRLKQQKAQQTLASEKASQRQNQQQYEQRQQQQRQQQQAYLYQRYQWQLQQALINEVRYPPWAKQFQQQGLISLNVTLDSNGEINTLALPPGNDETELLNEEVKRALNVIVTQVQPPQSLAGAPWTFALNYRFSLNGEPQPLLAEPVMPASLQGKSQQLDKTQALTEYKQRVRSQVLEALVYPKAAQVLKKQGKVSISVVLDSQGDVQQLEMTESSRHRELNKALEKAIRDAAPFGQSPTGQAVPVDIQYTFQL